MKNFMKLASGWHVEPLLLEIHRQPHLWDRNTARTRMFEGSPHRESHDIWIRYKDEAENRASGDYSNFGDPHDGVWYPAYYALPAMRPMIFGLMAKVEGERLGGILLYSIPPGKQVYPHVDKGWHVDFYEKFNICLQSNPRTTWFYHDEKFVSKAGDVHRIRNDIPHWVVNDGDDDHIVISVCIRTHDYRTRVKDVPAP